MIIAVMKSRLCLIPCKHSLSPIFLVSRVALEPASNTVV